MLSYDRLIKDKDLKLSPQQCRQLKSILDDYARYHQDLQAQLDDWKATGKNQILRILDARQTESPGIGAAELGGINQRAKIRRLYSQECARSSAPNEK